MFIVFPDRRLYFSTMGIITALHKEAELDGIGAI